ncbi:MAG TPA: isoamylase early set domain-containing protein [Phycisphaerae bacterium]|nr:isoamylase early set domain-containing protein [Phycisphaerae bacterium]
MIIKKGKSQVTFVYQPPNHCRSVAVVGSFNDWQADDGKMTRQKDGTYRKRLQLPPGQYRYKFLVDGQWIEDMQAEAMAPNEFGTQDCLVFVG